MLVADVQKILQQRMGDEAGSASVAIIAEKAGVSTRTVYRVLSPDPDKPTISLDLADRLTLAANSHLVNCRLFWPPSQEHPEGHVTPYVVD